VRGEDFDGIARGAESWDFEVGGRIEHAALPLPGLPGPIQVGNAASALMALRPLAGRLPLAHAAIERGLREVGLPGRFQRVDDPRGFEWVFDVAHNPAAAATLAASLRALPVAGRTIAVCGMLGDKDVPGVVRELHGAFDVWLAADAEGPRAIDASELQRRAATAGVELEPSGGIGAALRRAGSLARPGDRVVVFGSFHTVGPALACVGVHL
jgi:dihydrofolate synthase/folylpolyglutamate synthase